MHSSHVLFTVRQALELTGGSLAAGDTSTEIGGFSIDTRTLQPGDCFLAMPGARVDGHDFLEAARAKGATAAIVTREVAEPPAGMALLQVADAVQALQTLAISYRDRFAIPMLAVTGSNGKTSTRAAIAATLQVGLSVCMTRGNFNNHIGLPLSLFSLRPSHQVGVFEVGMNHLGEIADLCRILKPTLGVITNVGPAHLEGLGSLENVAKAKGELMEALPPEGELFVNADCELSRGIAARYAGTVRTVSPTRSDAYASCEDLRIEFQRLSGTIRLAGWERGIEFDAALSGRHMVFPLLFAAAVASRLGMDAGTIERGLARFKPEHGRMEVRSHDGVWVIDDCYNANPASMEAALDFLLSVPVPGRRFAVLGDMLELGSYSGDYHSRVIERCRKADKLERVYFFGKEFLAAAGGAGKQGRLELSESKEQIARSLREHLSPGDALLLKGSRGVSLEVVLDHLFTAAPH